MSFARVQETREQEWYCCVDGMHNSKLMSLTLTLTASSSIVLKVDDFTRTCSPCWYNEILYCVRLSCSLPLITTLPRKEWLALQY